MLLLTTGGGSVVEFTAKVETRLLLLAEMIGGVELVEVKTAGDEVGLSFSRGLTGRTGRGIGVGVGLLLFAKVERPT